jgi:hypothetical protein
VGPKTKIKTALFFEAPFPWEEARERKDPEVRGGEEETNRF